MNRIILDTNVFVAAAFNKKTASQKIIQAIQKGNLVLIWNDPTRNETRRILKKIPPLSWEEFSGLFRKKNQFHGQVFPEDFKQIPDPEDRKFAGLAQAADAVLISSDDDLLAHRHDLCITICTPGEFVEKRAPL